MERKKAPRDAEARPSPGSLAALVALGALSALWSLFLWAELVRARSGGTPFCPLAEGAQCTALWDAPVASLVHRLSGIPIAGWGMVWSLSAAALPLAALARQAEGRAAGALVSAVRVAAAAGVVAVFALLGVSAAERAFCTDCFVTYLLVAGYAGIALMTWRPLGLPQLSRGVALAAGSTAAAFLALLYPGLHTPPSVGEAGRQAVAGAGRRSLGTPSSPTGNVDAATNQKLAELVASLQAPLRQTLSDALYLYRGGAFFPPPPSRFLIGPAQAPVRLTVFTDIRCEHCASLHSTLAELRDYAPAGSFSVEPRQFPLDSGCNPLMNGGGDPVRCLAAKAQICLEGNDKAFEYSGALFAHQKTLTAEQVFELAAPYVPRPALESCVASAETARRLGDDIELAAKYDPEGTPIVLVNGRMGVSFAPFLYAVILTGGASDAPAFSSLPAPNPQAHLH